MNAGPMVTGSLVGSALTLGIAGPVAAVAGAAVAWGEEIGSMGAGGGTIKIDIEQAPAIIAELDNAIMKVKEIHGGGYLDDVVDPPGSDPYSQYAVNGIAEAESRHGEANSAYLEILTETRDKLQKSFAAYQQGDRGAASQVAQASS